MYIVVFDDDGGVCAPMGWDEACDGAICSTNGDVATFQTRKEAQRAIRISKAYARLCLEQGEPINSDFIGDCAKLVKIRKLKARGK